MGVRFPSVFTTGISNALPANANETVIATLPPLNPELDFATVFLHWFADILAGTGTTALLFRIRRGTTANGNAINAGSWIHTLAAGSTAVVGGCYPDIPGAVAGQQYVLTCTQTGATGAGTINDLSLLAYVL